MNSTSKDLIPDKRALLSILWIFVLINMIYADIIGMLKPGYLEILEQTSRELSGETVLLFAILMEIPISMIILSKILNRKVNRVANFITVPISILWVVGPIFMNIGGPTPLSYLFFASIEVIAMLTIVYLACKWSEK